MEKVYKHFQIPFIQLENYTLDVDIVKKIPEKLARKFQVIALEEWVNILTVGMVNPNDKKTINMLEKKLKYKIMPIKVGIQEWANTINNNYLKEN